MSGMQHINRINIPKSCINTVYDHLRAMGTSRLEGVALLAGYEDDHGNFQVEATIVPEQESKNMEDGLLYSVSGDELHRINVWLYQNKLTLITQVHSHPGVAYHSDTDDAFPIVAFEGGVSIVIPDFGFGPASPTQWAVYRLQAEGNWVKLDQSEVDGLINIL